MNEWDVLSCEFNHLVCKTTWEKPEVQPELHLILFFFNPVFICQCSVFYGFYSQISLCLWDLCLAHNIMRLSTHANKTGKKKKEMGYFLSIFTEKQTVLDILH